MRDYIFNKILSTLLVLQLILLQFVRKNPEWIEKNYSNGLYPYLSRLLRRFIGWIPVSVGDIVYFLLALLILRWVWLLIRTRLSPFRQHIFALGAFLSVVFFLFHLLWGLNYYRIPLASKLGIQNEKYSFNELLLTTQFHIDNLNKIQLQIVSNDSLAVSNTFKRKKMYRMGSKIYKDFYTDSLDLHFSTKSCKNSLYSLPLSYMGFSGYLNPFTGEAQVNYKIPKITYPATICHEMAHQLGYASEDEANYIGYLACEKSENLLFRYSGELMAVQHLLYTIAQNNKSLYEEYKDKLNYGIRLNIQNNRDFWDSYQNPLEPVFKNMYDSYLKANKQKDGIQSYNAMVVFLIHEYFSLKK